MCVHSNRLAHLYRYVYECEPVCLSERERVDYYLKDGVDGYKFYVSMIPHVCVCQRERCII